MDLYLKSNATYSINLTNNIISMRKGSDALVGSCSNVLAVRNSE